MRINVLIAAAAAALLATLPLSGAMASDIGKGRKTFESYCASCHGDDGQSMVPGTPSFANGDGLFVTDSVLVDRIRTGNGIMPAFRGLLSDDEIRDVISYLRTLPR